MTVSEQTSKTSDDLSRTSGGLKHVALEHLYIIKEYIDKQTDKTISSAEGFHGIRYYNGKLQAKDAASGAWFDVATDGSGGGVDIADNKDVENLFGNG